MKKTPPDSQGSGGTTVHRVMHKPRTNTKNIKRFQAYMAAKGTPVTKHVDVYHGVWSEKTAAKPEVKK